MSSAHDRRHRTGPTGALHYIGAASAAMLEGLAGVGLRFLFHCSADPSAQEPQAEMLRCRRSTTCATCGAASKDCIGPILWEPSRLMKISSDMMERSLATTLIRRDHKASSRPEQ